MNKPTPDSEQYFINNKDGLITTTDILIKNSELILDKTPTDKKPIKNSLVPYNISHEKNIPINIQKYNPDYNYNYSYTNEINGVILDHTPTDKKPSRYNLEPYNINHEKNIPINIQRYNPDYNPDI